MSTNPESMPTVWSDADIAFFCAVANTFSSPFLWGASSLLASYDVNTTDAPATMRSTGVSLAKAPMPTTIPSP